MTVTKDAFNRAWLMLKSQPEGMAFTKAEKDEILNIIVKMMQSNDAKMQMDAEELFKLYSNSMSPTPHFSQ
tara:strand:+ start:278 stop:490 length:213 start_codon:yes stop_codon:yes gene_type:complete